MRSMTAVVLSIVLAFGMAACKKGEDASGGGSGGGGGGGGVDTSLCETKSKCPNEGPPLSFAVDMCKEMLAESPCVDEFRVQQQCMTENEKCTDEGKSSAVMTSQACQPQIRAFIECQQAAEGSGEQPAAP